MASDVQNLHFSANTNSPYFTIYGGNYDKGLEVSRYRDETQYTDEYNKPQPLAFEGIYPVDTKYVNGGLTYGTEANTMSFVSDIWVIPQHTGLLVTGAHGLLNFDIALMCPQLACFNSTKPYVFHIQSRNNALQMLGKAVISNLNVAGYDSRIIFMVKQAYKILDNTYDQYGFRITVNIFCDTQRIWDWVTKTEAYLVATSLITASVTLAARRVVLSSGAEEERHLATWWRG